MTRTLTELLRALEERSRQCPNRVVRLTGTVDAEPCELLIFRGFSSSTTSPELSPLHTLRHLIEHCHIKYTRWTHICSAVDVDTNIARRVQRG